MSVHAHDLVVMGWWCRGNAGSGLSIDNSMSGMHMISALQRVHASVMSIVVTLQYDGRRL
jgi:hypothetical protein